MRFSNLVSRAKRFIARNVECLIVALVFLVVSATAFAQGAPPPSFDEIAGDIQGLIGAIGGMGSLAIVLAIVQILMKLSKTMLGKLAGKWNLLLVTGLTLVASVASAMLSGGSLLGALMSGGVLVAAQVFINQIIKQVKK